MRLYAFAALLALPLLAIAAPGAKADYYHKKCCGEGYNGGHNGYEPEFRIYYVKRPAVVFGCDGYHCKTDIKLKAHTTIKAVCERGWCRIKSSEFKNAWVLEECLIAKDYGHEGDEGGYENGDES